MSEILFQGRKATTFENNSLRVTVLHEGGHIAEVFDKQAGVSPLWVPPWKSIEPSAYDPGKHPELGESSDAKLLGGIMGHNLCLDLFGSPSTEEAAAGLTDHGESSVNRYEVEEASDGLLLRSTFPLSQLAFTRTLQLQGQKVRVRETVENLTALDRPIAWTEHVTLGPPFLDPATTRFRASMTRSMVFESEFGAADYLKEGTEFLWPLAPHRNGGMADLTQMNPLTPAGGYTAHLADPQHENAFFIAHSPQFHLAFGYIWKRADFPWMGIWEENRSRATSPWSGQTVTRGMEFGVSPFPESRRQMIERTQLFDTPAYRWLPARGRLEAEYWIISQSADAIPETLSY